MAAVVHPHDSLSPKQQNPEKDAVPPPKPDSPQSEKSDPKPGTYVIQIPKDQILRVPPPENAKRFQQLSKRKPGRGKCRRCFCFFLATLFVFLLAVGIAAGVFYLVVRPKSPEYSVQSLAIEGFNLTSSSSFSPEFNVNVRANNPNNKIGIYYEKDSSVRVYYHDINICSGSLPVFYQPKNNVTVFQMALKGSGLELTSTMQTGLQEEENIGAVPFKLKFRAPVKIKVGAVKTWTITVKMTCDISVDKLTAASKMVSNHCEYGGVDLW
ncbi:hypothetical protein SLA2020_083840 [Shorea laevis]